MLSIAEYKSKHIDRTGLAPAILLNAEGETLYLKDVQSVTSTKGRIKMKWRATNVYDQWHDYTHIALVRGDEIAYISEITPVNFDGKAHNLEVTFYE